MQKMNSKVSLAVSALGQVFMPYFWQEIVLFFRCVLSQKSQHAVDLACVSGRKVFISLGINGLLRLINAVSSGIKLKDPIYWTL